MFIDYSGEVGKNKFKKSTIEDSSLSNGQMNYNKVRLG